ncbi:MAG: hypothetical protein ACOCW2_02180, partial [Chitinivibrionales bacterium]
KKVEGNIRKRHQNIQKLLRRIFDGLFPGSGALYSRQKIHSGISLMALSSVVYAAYAMVITVNFSYPFWVVKPLFSTVLTGCLLYSLSFFAYAVIQSVKDFSGERNHVN